MPAIIRALNRPIDGRTCFLAISFLLFNVFDAHASLYFIKHSAHDVEINPINFWLLSHGSDTFLIGKIFAATLVVVVLAARIHLRHVRHVLYFAFGFYGLNTIFLLGSFIVIQLFYGGIK